MAAQRRRPAPLPRDPFGKRAKPSSRLDFLFDGKPEPVSVPVPDPAPAPPPIARHLGWKAARFDLASAFLPARVLEAAATASRLLRGLAAVAAWR